MVNPEKKKTKKTEKKKMPPSLGTAFAIIKSAIRIPLTSYAVFTFLTCLPLIFSAFSPFLMMITLLKPASSSSLDDTTTSNNTLEFLDSISQILNVVLGDFFKFFLAITTVHAASKIYVATPHPSIGGSPRPMSLPHLLRHSINDTRRTGIAGLFLTFWLTGLFASISRTVFSLVVHPVTHLAEAVVSSVLFGFLNLGVILAILQGSKTGCDAFWAAFDLTKGNRTCGAILMLLHGAWCWAMAVGWPSLMMTFFDGLESSQGVALEVVHQGLVHVGAVMNLVVLVVYYHGCRNRQRMKKNIAELMETEDDHEAGSHLV
ncbi:hypothetical protein PanWU01x14_160480 [Parasponia andersonii]|uniref:Transmembrane protein n=1 Tax=Parasponia andersonii TaxID=3476 RepID=A0A2P5CE16_PARAD|nr:hypothetical protein PanWU01x14_160480 [Parasponia andersonii]